MGTLALSSLMSTLVPRNDLAALRLEDRPARSERKVWRRIGRLVNAEPSYRQEQYGAPTGLFILGYGKLPGPQESPRR